MTATIITPYMKRKIEREEAIYNEFNEMMKQPGAMATAVTAEIMEKYGLAAASTVWSIRRRVEKRRAAQKEAK